MSVSKSQANDTQQDAFDFSSDTAITVGVRMHNDVPCVTYIRQPLSTVRLSSGPPTAQLHRYLPLPPNCIRLLMRVPRPDPDLLSFNFLTCSLDDIKLGEFAYTAISYCWGDLPADRPLGLGEDSYIPITPKVIDILTHIVSRHPVASSGEDGLPKHHKESPLIWLDAVCINQKDNTERATQIPLMADIYRHASSVDIWLDSGPASTALMKTSLWDQSWTRTARLDVGMSRKRDGWHIEPYSDVEITELMWSPWFSRAWVVQEFCFGKDHCFHFMDMTITILFLKMVHEWGSDLAFCRLLDESTLRCEVPISPLVQNMQSLFSLRDQVHLEQNHLRPLEDVLGRFFSMKTTDPRDKIFAMLGLARGDCLKHITVNYDIPVPDLFLQVMAAISEDITNFTLLSFAGLAAPRPLLAKRRDIPTWVPDFSESPCHSAWSSHSRGFNATALPEHGGVRSKCRVVDDPTLSPPRKYTLLLHGVCCDVVIGMIRGDRAHNLSRLPKLVRKAMAVVQSLRPYPSGESAQDVLRKTLIAANPDYLKRDPKGEGFESFYTLVRGDNDAFDLDNAWSTEGRYLQTVIAEGTAGSCGVFWTRNGFIGLAANQIEVGDEVWLVKGARVPFIFRGPVLPSIDKGGHLCRFYHLVCEAYIHGIMNGERWSDEADTSTVFLL